MRVFFSSVSGPAISLGALQKKFECASSAIAPHYEAIGQVTRSSEVNHIDETSGSEKNVLQSL
jgi:hypothetical protein